jgi:3-isopropylmalate/(R)-2-methylmalate dehydratase small subunit
MRVWKFGNDIDTDAIIPGRYLTLYDPRELAAHAFEGTRDAFAREASEGDMIVAGRNFGCGSSREHAPIAIRGAGVQVIVAVSFARIFYRNCISTGVLPIICPEADSITEDKEIILHLDEGYLTAGKRTLAVEPVPAFMRKIIDAGGLVEYAKTITELELCTK